MWHYPDNQFFLNSQERGGKNLTMNTYNVYSWHFFRTKNHSWGGSGWVESVTAPHVQQCRLPPCPLPQAGTFQSPLSSLSLPTHCPVDHLSNQTLDSRTTDEFLGAAWGKMMPLKTPACTTKGWAPPTDPPIKPTSAKGGNVEEKYLTCFCCKYLNNFSLFVPNYFQVSL